jgi:hypothetical protein
MSKINSSEKNKVNQGAKKLVRTIAFQSACGLFYSHPPTFIGSLVTLSTYHLVKDPAFAKEFQLSLHAAAFVDGNRSLILGGKSEEPEAPLPEREKRRTTGRRMT